MDLNGVTGVVCSVLVVGVIGKGYKGLIGLYDDVLTISLEGSLALLSGLNGLMGLSSCVKGATLALLLPSSLRGCGVIIGILGTAVVTVIVTFSLVVTALLPAVTLIPSSSWSLCCPWGFCSML